MLDEIWQKVPKGLTIDGRVVVLSTPLGDINWSFFYKKFKREKMMRVKYLRDKNRQPYACFVHSNGDFGWSLCAKGEQFDKKVGRSIALTRAESIAHLSLNDVPQSIRKEYIDFVKRTFVFEGVSEIKCIAKACIRSFDEGDSILNEYKESLERELETVKETIDILDVKIRANGYLPF